MFMCIYLIFKIAMVASRIHPQITKGSGLKNRPSTPGHALPIKCMRRLSISEMEKRTNKLV